MAKGLITNKHFMKLNYLYTIRHSKPSPDQTLISW